MTTLDIPEWGPEYPNPDTLRREASLMAEAYVEAVLEEIPRHEIRGIYLKGSARKRWDSPIDYVPEVSDVDMHIDFHREDAWPEYLGTVDQALRVQSGAERRYLSKVSSPIHTPRPQVMVLNKVMSEMDDFIHSPAATVEVLFGNDYPAGDYSDPDSIRRIECGRIIKDLGFVEQLPMHVIDRPGRYIWEAVRSLVWRVSPTGPRVLHFSGMGTEEAWSLNRTAIVPRIAEAGYPTLAQEYLGFYVSAWKYFLSGYKDFDAGRAAITAAVACLEKGAEAARMWLATASESSG